MGSRGASSGIAKNGKKYGSEYMSVMTVGNVKFVVKNEGSETAPMETMTKGRVYAMIGTDGQIRAITYYDNDGKRVKQIDVTGRPHPIDGAPALPHIHYGYEHSEGGTYSLTRREERLVGRVLKAWEKYGVPNLT